MAKKNKKSSPSKGEEDSSDVVGRTEDAIIDSIFHFEEEKEDKPEEEIAQRESSIVQSAQTGISKIEKDLEEQLKKEKKETPDNTSKKPDIANDKMIKKASEELDQQEGLE